MEIEDLLNDPTICEGCLLPEPGDHWSGTPYAPSSTCHCQRPSGHVGDHVGEGWRWNDKAARRVWQGDLSLLSDGSLK
jgi:hypothetical protein